MGLLKALYYKDNPDHCNICGKKLNNIEKEYYGCTCERCEGKLWERINKEDREEDKKWRKKLLKR